MLRSASPVSTSDFQEDFAWLHSLEIPRPFVWLPLVQRRRFFYVLLAMVLVVVCEGWPELMSLRQMRDGVYRQEIVNMQQVPIYLGMLVVVAFLGTCYALYQQFDNSKWLARYGEIAEANLLGVLRGDNELLVTYRFFDTTGKEFEREATITAEGGVPVPKLAAGDIVPLLYDRKQPGRRNLLWCEVARYVKLKKISRAGARPPEVAPSVGPQAPHSTA